MSTIENQHTSQKQKPFKRRTQDHGDAASQRGLRRYSEFFEDKTRESATKKVAEIHQAALADKDERPLSPDDMVLPDDYYALEQPPTDLAYLIDETEATLAKAKTAFEQETAEGFAAIYKDLSRQREALLDHVYIGTKQDEDSVDVLTLIRSIEVELDLIEGDLIEAANDRDSFPSDVEYGITSRREIKREMARRATLDADTDDDYGDDDYHVGIRIRTRL